MNVEHILSEKGRSTVTITADKSLAEAVGTLNKNRIGAVVVVNGEGEVVGIVSERDVIRALGEHGASALEEKVADRMTAKVVTCTRSASMNDLMELMTQGKFRHVPVVESRRLIGIVSIGDVVKHRLEQIETEHQALKEYVATA